MNMYDSLKIFWDRSEYNNTIVRMEHNRSQRRAQCMPNFEVGKWEITYGYIIVCQKLEKSIMKTVRVLQIVCGK